MARGAATLDARVSREGVSSTLAPAAAGTPLHSGERVVLWLFAVLAASVVAVFAAFSLFLEPGSRAWLIPVVMRNLYLPVVATSMLVSIDAYRRRRSGWWVYLVTAPVPGINVALAVAWMLRWRASRRSVGRWTL